MRNFSFRFLETSFQMGSESEDSDSLSKSATIKSAPRSELNFL